MTSYFCQSIISGSPVVTISEDQFAALKVAKEVLTAAFALEESYDLLVGNYVEMEQELLAAAAENIVRNMRGYQDAFKVRSTINRRVANLLTATRLYFDQVPQYLGRSAKDPEAVLEAFRTQTNNHHSTSFAYRFCEALRNHVQHRGLAVHIFGIGKKKFGNDNYRGIESSIQLSCEKRYLIADKAFKKQILDDMPEKIDLTQVIRTYLECIGNLHMFVRTCVADNANAARQTIHQHLSAYADTNAGKNIGLMAFSDTDPAGVPLLLEWDDVRLELISRNSTLEALSRRFVTGRIRSDQQL